MFEVGEGTLQHAESAGKELNPVSLAFIGLTVSSPDLPDHEEDLVRLRVRVYVSMGEEGKENGEERHLRFRAKRPPISCRGNFAVSPRDTRAKGIVVQRTANFLGLMASMGKPIKKDTTKQAAAPAMQRRKPTKRSQRERAK